MIAVTPMLYAIVIVCGMNSSLRMCEKIKCKTSNLTAT